MGFPRLLSIFYCTFHPVQGPKVLYEVPEGSILSKTSPLVDFDSISEYLIPKVELCSKLVTISTPTCKVMGFPINLEHKKFQRNALMFNLAFVFDKDAETSSYEPVVRKMARVLKALEKESEFLSRQTRLAMLASGAILMMNNSSINNIMSAAMVSTPPAISSGTNGGLFNSSRTTIGGASTVDPPPTGSSNSGALETISESTSSISLSETATDNSDKEKVQTIGSNGTSTALPASSIPNALAVPENSATTTTASLPPLAPGTINTLLSSLTVAGQSTPNITTSVLVSSPPSMSISSITSALMAPSSSSPFPQSKSSLTSSNNSSSTNWNGTVSASSSQKTMLALPALLTQDQTDGNGMQNLIEQLIEDLNSYCECQIPIDSANTINLKLFPTYPNPSPVYDYQVPISTVNLEALTDVNWDMTMQRITGFINGVHSVKRIAEFADVETGLARMCMQHLLYYGCIIMVDLFQFKNIYAVKLEMMRLTEDVALQNECVSYVTLPDMHAPSFAKIFSLYCSLQYGVVLQDWIEQNQIADFNIDVRRFISFGVIKGFLYRVHKYPILDYHDPATAGLIAKPSEVSLIGQATVAAPTASTPASAATALTPLTAIAAGTSTVNGSTNHVSNRPGTPSSTLQKKTYGDTLAPSDQNTRPNQNPHHQKQNNHLNGINHSDGDTTASKAAIPPALRRLLNGEHHYDELCTMFGCSVREMDQILGTDNRVKFIYR